MYRQCITRIVFPQKKLRKCKFQVDFFRKYALISGSSAPSNLEITNLSPDVSVPLIKRTLEKNGCSYEDGYACITTKCVNCRKDKSGTLYINKVTGFFMCLDCQDRGNWEFFAGKITTPSDKDKTTASDTKGPKKKAKKSAEPPSEGTTKWNELLLNCKSIVALNEEQLQDIFSSFKLGNFNPDILRELNALIDETSKNLYFPLTCGNKNIVGVKQLTLKNDEHCFPAKGCMGIIKYIPSKVRKKCDSAVVVLGLKDIIALSALRPNMHIIYLPHGTVMLPQEILPLLEQYKKLILWFGNDAVNLDAARMFSKKLGEQRCFLIRKADLRPHKYIKSRRSEIDIGEILSSAQPMAHQSITTFSNLREDIWSELTNVDKAQGIKWQRFPLLNEYVRGHRRGELTILTGPTGCGKTTFLSEYSLDLALQGVSTLWGSFEIRNQRLALTMLQQMVFSPLTENLEHFNTWANEFEKLPIYFLKFHGPQPVKKVMDVVEHATYVHDIQHLVIDNLQFMMGLSPGSERFMDRFYKQDLVIGAFRTFATQFNCHVTLIIHPRKEKETDELSISSIFGGAKASQEADNIFIIQKKMLQSLQVKKYLQIVKNRYSGELGLMPLNFHKASLSFAAKNVKEKEKSE
ncbi:mitochondrial DNA helicase [Planococcus citri]|uniref:mitochondrial DNA helicase n=1 Tax=Planococcus citri TaxID=170843 RepID=UPI0031F80A67